MTGLIPGVPGSDLLRRVRGTHPGNPGRLAACGAKVGRQKVVEEAQDGWFAGQRGTSESAEESARVTARLATPSDYVTRAGLPLRQSRAHLVPGAYESGAEPSAPHRSPEELRERMRGYRSGQRRPRED
jgi:hypothetical protein